MHQIRAIARRLLAMMFTVLTLGLVEVSDKGGATANRAQAPISDVEPIPDP